MRALEELPTATKNLIVPIIRLRPWLTAKKFFRAIERVQEAFGDRALGLDLDPIARGRRDTEAQVEFDSLFDASRGWENYFNLVKDVPLAVPVLRFGPQQQLLEQLNHVEKIGRGLFVRVDVQSPLPITPIAEACKVMAIENVVFVFDCGWRDHLLPLQARCVALVRAVADISADFEIVVGGGDFPSSGFDDKGTRFSIPGEERDLVQSVRRRINDVDIVFGDWASAREPTIDNQIRRGRARLDMPSRTGWDCWRSPTPEGSYRELAAAAANDRNLGAMSDFWGEQVIIATRVGGEPAIKNPTTAAAVRMNLHMILQAHFDSAGPEVGDERLTTEL